MADLTAPRSRPLVFLGPSAPVADVTELLPEAEIRGPVTRGDLHEARLLRYSMFVIIDGVFSQQNAISPREVVDVLRDGATVLGGGSMGALRAADCAPAGAEGAGRIWRLMRRQALASEDEVAVLYLPERPYPALTVALANVRVALRRAFRAGSLPAPRALSLAAAAERLIYTERTWRAIFDEAGEPPCPDLLAALRSHDAKREDARSTLRLAARRIAGDPSILARPRRTRGGFGLMGPGRAHPTDPLLGREAEAIAPGFLLWMTASGRAPAGLRQRALPLLGVTAPETLAARLPDLRWEEVGPAPHLLRPLAEELESALARDGRLDAERLRFAAICHGAMAAQCEDVVADPRDKAATDLEMWSAHRVNDWHGLLKTCSGPETARSVFSVRDAWALARAWRRARDERGWEHG